MSGHQSSPHVCLWHGRMIEETKASNLPQFVSHSRRDGVGNGVSAGKTARMQSGCTFSNRVVPGPETKIETCGRRQNATRLITCVQAELFASTKYTPTNLLDTKRGIHGGTRVGHRATIKERDRHADGCKMITDNYRISAATNCCSKAILAH